MGISKSKATSYLLDQTHFETSYTLLTPLGEGGFGTIYTIRSNQTCTEHVVKSIKRKGVPMERLHSTGEKVPREVKITAGLQHPNIIKLLDFYTLRKNYLLILEYHAGWVDLFDFTAKKRRMEEDSSKKIMTQVLSTLTYLHTELSVAHLDIKPENILLNPADLSVKLLDFGAANYITPGKPMDKFEGTRQYAAPDILFRGSFDPVHADIWASGVTLYRLVVGDLPFHCPEDYYDMLRFPSRISVYCQHVLCLMLCRQSELRPGSVEEVLRAPFFSL